MEVQLYVYDLSRGMARQFSGAFLGVQIDAVYHTSIVLGGIEYFYGAGIQTSYPGMTHHGAPMEVISLGKTDLPTEVILEYLESLKETYTTETYDLFMHNCNNFSHDFAMFLVGKPIPSHITSLPETVLQTPFGQMLRPQLDAAMRTVTQAQVPPPLQPLGSTASTNQLGQNGTTSTTIHRATLDRVLDQHPAIAALKPQRISYSSIPPLEKLIAKLGDQGRTEIIKSVTAFLNAVNSNKPAQETTLPDLDAFASWLTESTSSIPTKELFAAFDLVRISMTEHRVSGWFLADGLSTLAHLFAHLNTLDDRPFNLTLVALQLAVNISSSPIAHSTLFASAGKDLLAKIIEYVNPYLLNMNSAAFSELEKGKTHSAAVAAVFNLTFTHQIAATEEKERLSEDQKVELAASLIEAIDASDSTKATEEGRLLVKRMILALAFLVIGSDVNDSEIRDLSRAMDVQGIIQKKGKLFGTEKWLSEVAELVS